MAEVRILYIATAQGLIQLANPGKSDRWREIGRALDGQDVLAVAASPADPLLAYAGGHAGVERTTNGGASWERVAEREAASLVFDDELIVLRTPAGELLSSVDGSEWSAVDRAAAAQELTVPNTGGHPDRPTGALLELHGAPPALLVGTSGPLLRSDDGGATLTPIDGPHGVTALVSPQRAVDQAFAGTSSGELWFSADRGRSWARLASGFAAIHSLAFARAL